LHCEIQAPHANRRRQLPQRSGQFAAVPAAAPKPASPPAAPTDEKALAADRSLSLAKSYIAAQNYAAARSRLEKLIDTYPTTPAAKEAKVILQDIQGK
jgi:Tfp pilus assembly protein PilF